MVKIKWSKQALADLKIIFDFIDNDSRRYANDTINQLIQSTEILKSQPLVGRIVPEFSVKNIREIFYKSYRIVYQIENISKVNVLGVSHSARILKLPFFKHSDE